MQGRYNGNAAASIEASPFQVAEKGLFCKQNPGEGPSMLAYLSFTNVRSADSNTWWFGSSYSSVEFFLHGRSLLLPRTCSWTSGDLLPELKGVGFVVLHGKS